MTNKIILIITLALLWAHVAPQVVRYNEYREFAKTISTCSVKHKWVWKNLAFQFWVEGCFNVTTHDTI